MSYLYVIAHPEGWRKIGRAQNPAIRIKQHQQICGQSLLGEAVFKCANARSAERTVLDKLSPFRITGEWFKVDLSVAIETISEVTGTEAEPFPKPSAKNGAKLLSLRTETVKAIEAFRATKRPIPSKSEAVRMILDDWLMSHGYLEN